MQFAYALLNSRSGRRGCFYQQQKFLSGIDIPLPAVYRSHRAEDVDARSQSLLNESVGDSFCFLFRPSSGQDKFRFWLFHGTKLYLRDELARIEN